ncbi:MAG: T9SS type A sorting domain-containing protein [Bacteroidales bacterium]|nr:T9SS type A sorting domain-containing protein [Bacteroidales bacterium]
MKSNKKLYLISTIILLFFSCFAQVPDSIYYNRLFYVCKAWGHVKYYHTEIANGSVNWDDALINTLCGIKNAPDNISFNDSLLTMLSLAGSMGVSPDPLPSIPDSLNNNNDYSWIQNPIFSDTARTFLDTIRARFRPQNNVYVDEAYPGGNPIFDNDDLYTSGQNFPTEEKRILALFRYWNIIHYFYPYKYIMDQNWDTTLVEFIPQVIESYDALSYHLAFKKLTTRINDSHAFFYSPTYWNWLGNGYTPFLARFIENEMVITKVLPQIVEVDVGDILKEIDGQNIYELRDSLREFAHGSNNEFIEKEINEIILKGSNGSFSITVDNGTNIHSETLYRNNSNYNQLQTNTNPVWKDTIINGTCSFGVVDMGKLEIADISSMFSDLWDTDAIIFDLRNIPNNTLWYIVDYLYESSIHIANFTVPDITYPGRLYWKETNIGTGTTNPYTGHIIILFDERTQSQAEYTCMGLEQFPDAIKIGSTTAASDGNIAAIYLPGNIDAFATFLGTYYPDYTPTQRIGIIPDFEVYPTILGIRSNHDEVMEFALNCNLVDIMEAKNTGKIKLYPNPATDAISYTLTNKNPFLIEVYNLQGQKLKTINVSSASGIIDISELKSGIYAIRIYNVMSTEVELIIKE